MANRHYTIEQILLQGWTDEATGEDKPIRIYPLTIKKFKRLAEILDRSNEDTDDDGNPKEDKSFLDIILEATAFCMQTFEPELSDIDVLGDYIDYPTMQHVLEIAGGVTLGDPNQIAAGTAGTNF